MRIPYCGLLRSVSARMHAVAHPSASQPRGERNFPEQRAAPPKPKIQVPGIEPETFSVLG